MKYANTTREELEGMTGSQLVEVYNDLAEPLGHKPVKKFATHEKALERTWAAVKEAQAKDTGGDASTEDGEAPLAGKFTRCPHCETHLSNGFISNGDEVGGETIHLGHEFECMACGGEFGEEVEPVDDDARERRKGDRRNDEKPEDDPIERKAVIRKEREPRPALRKDDRILTAGDSPSGRMVVMGAIWEAASENEKGISQGDLIQKVLDEFEPPRSKRFGRDYILGYISHGLQKGYLKEQKA